MNNKYEVSEFDEIIKLENCSESEIESYKQRRMEELSIRENKDYLLRGTYEKIVTNNDIFTDIYGISEDTSKGISNSFIATFQTYNNGDFSINASCGTLRFFDTDYQNQIIISSICDFLKDKYNLDSRKEAVDLLEERCSSFKIIETLNYGNNEKESTSIRTLNHVDIEKSFDDFENNKIKQFISDKQFKHLYEVLPEELKDNKNFVENVIKNSLKGDSIDYKKVVEIIQSNEDFMKKAHENCLKEFGD